ncbi:hypothetical protein [Acinetobacter sp. ANC 4640]
MSKERPILFNAEMVKAILDGRKTQTRRILKSDYDEMVERDNGNIWPWREDCENGGDYWYPCPFGQVGDRLWIRETCIISPKNWLSSNDQLNHKDIIKDSDGDHRVVQYLATNSDTDVPLNDFKLKKTPSIHMPRWASRILLEITNIRVERLNDISEADAIAEGVEPISVPDNVPVEGGYTKANRAMWKGYQNNERAYRDTAKDSFMSLWKSVYGADSWVANPWVWVIEFKVIEGATQ